MTQGKISRGLRVGQLKLLYQLGSGGYGSVWEAASGKGKDRCSVKFLSPTKDDESASRRRMFRKQFEREVSFVKQHSGEWTFIPQFFTDGKLGDVPYYVMERLEQFDLPHEDAAIQTFVSALLSAISTLHSTGYVHCDLKPENIMRRASTGELVLIDFGAVHKLEEFVWTGLPIPSVSIDSSGKRVIFGTNNYLDYATLEDNPHSAQRDIFAVGQIIRDCFPNVVPYEWNEIIDRCKVWGKSARNRYSSIQEVEDAVANLDESKKKTYSQVRRNYLTDKRLIQNESANYDPVTMDWESVLVCSRAPDSDMEYLVADFNDEKRPDLKKKTVRFKQPLRLTKNQVLKLIGPVVIDADISGARGSVVILSQSTVLHNCTKIRQPKNATTYLVGGSTYLNFTELTDSSFAEVFKGERRIYRSMTAGTQVAYRGPRTLADIRDLFIADAKRSGMPVECKKLLEDYYEGRTLFLKPI